MLTDEDIQKLLNALPQFFVTREEMDLKFEAMHESFSELQVSIDAYAKKADAYFQEMVMLSHKVDRIESWVRKIAKETGVTLEG